MNDQLYYLTSQKKTTNHILHLLMCIPTCGLWVFVWGITMRSNDWHNRKIDKQIRQILQHKGQNGRTPSNKSNWIESDSKSKW
ncbi:hypothetical protein [Pseudomonas jessenii]|uniref:hypothetical protein n=1 Tax=Pseudomonas jessenii TaxID=77298 RepID=UPI00389173D2